MVQHVERIEADGDLARLLARAQLEVARRAKIERREAGGLEAVARHAGGSGAAAAVVEQIQAERLVIGAARVHRHADTDVENLHTGASEQVETVAPVEIGA